MTVWKRGLKLATRSPPDTKKYVTLDELFIDEDICYNTARSSRPI